MGDHNDPYFSQPIGDKGFGFEPDRPRRGCFFYGCLGVLIAGVVGVILLAMLSFTVYRVGSQLVAEYTATAPEPVPVVELPTERVEAIEARVEAFQDDARAGRAATIRLTPEEINGLIAADPNLRGRVAIDIVDDQIEGRISLPLESLGLPSVIYGGLKGRFLNGDARFTPVLKPDGGVTVRIDALSVKGVPAPRELLDRLNEGEIEIHFDQDEPRRGEFFRRVERIEVEDGALVLTSRPREAAGTDATTSPVTEPDDATEAPPAAPPEPPPPPF